MKTELLEKYRASLPDRSKSEYSAKAAKFLEWAGEKELNADLVRKWEAHMKKQGYADGTIHQSRGILQRLFAVNGIAWPFRRGDAPVVRENEVWAPALATTDINTMVQVARGLQQPAGNKKPDARHRAFLCLATVWGLRRVEMCAMKPDSLQPGVIFVETAKHGRQRYHTLPDWLEPYLSGWGFKYHVSESLASDLFVDLKQMIGLRDVGGEIGWHSVRRACLKEAYAAVGQDGERLNEAEITSFYRWKRSTTNMAQRYATSRTVGSEETVIEVGDADRLIDEKFYRIHAFPQMWR